VPDRLPREHPGVELPEDATLILSVLMQIRAEVRAIRELLEEEDDDDEGDEEGAR
jgi:hypothetical protein